MYSKKSWGGKVDPFILVKFLKHPEKNKAIEDPIASVVIWSVPARHIPLLFQDQVLTD